jgi:outer membrane protein assembly factor BamB
MNWVCRLIATIFLVADTGTSVWSQTSEPANLHGDSTQTRKRLAEAEQKLIAGKTADATDDLQRIMDEASTDLITIDGKQFRTAQWTAQKILSKLPPEALRNYRDQIETPARKLLDLAKSNRDPATLWQLLDKYFVSRPADEGLLLLGDILFERGEFRTAELVWSRLIPESNADIIYPATKSDPAQVQARIILAAIFQGDLDRANSLLAAFKARYPESRGTLAGKSGLLATILSEQLNAPPKLSMSTNSGTDWPAFGGGPDHAASVGSRLPVQWDAMRVWDQKLAVEHQHPDQFVRRLWTPFGHPVIANGQVFVTDGLRLYGFDLLTGSPTDLKEIYKKPLTQNEPTKPVAVPCPTLTVAGGKLYVRTGPAVFRASDTSGSAKSEESKIICFELNAGISKGLRELWSVTAPIGDEKATTVWEGAPQVSGRRLWAAYARFEGGRIVHGIACYDPADSNIKPDHPKWTADVCDSQISLDSNKRTRQELVTIVGRRVVFCSNTGVVSALDASTGSRCWAFRYPRSKKIDGNRTSDPAPAVVYGGRVFLAPTDTDRVYALDPENGALLWESGRMEGAQIVGVAAGRLIVTTTGEYHGIRGLNVEDGSSNEPEGWFSYRWNGPQRHGLGFVTEDRIFWPTTKGLRVLTHSEGKPSEFTLYGPNGSPSGVNGNIVYADGVLIVVSADHISAYFSELKRFGPANQQSKGDPAQLQFKKISSYAELLLADGKTTLARKTLVEAARSELPRRYRAWAVARLLLLTPKADAENKLPEDLRGVLTPELRSEWVFRPNGIPTTLEAMLQEHLGRESPKIQSRPIPNSNAIIQLAESPELNPEAEVERTIRLPFGSAPLQWMCGSRTHRGIYLSTSTELLVYSLAKGEQTRYQAVAEFTHVEEMPEGFIAAGPFSIAAYGKARTPSWVFRVPVADLLPSRLGEYRMYTDDVTLQPELSAFHFCDSWLVARLGERHLIAFDLHNRRVAWVLSTNGKQLQSAKRKDGFHPTTFPEEPRFGTEFFMNSRFIVVQLSDGQRWIIRTEKGDVLNVPSLGEDTARVKWILPPASIATKYLAVADGPAMIRLLNLSTGQIKWSTCEERRVSSLAGDPAQLRCWDELLLVAIRRNHGVELDRIALSNGKSLWAEGAAFLDTPFLRLDDADADSDRVYLPVGNALVAIDLKSGKVAWEAELPDLQGVPGWVVRAGQRCVIVHPRVAVPREDPVEVGKRMIRTLRTNLEIWRLPALAFGLYDAWVARSLPIMMFDLETGRSLGKIEVPAKGPAMTICFDGNRAIVATGDRLCWLK